MRFRFLALEKGMHEDFAANLRLLCSYRGSIAEVCRQLKINRPQFNRYLGGRHLPSAHILRRLCDFFGVEEHEILLPAARFAELVQLRPRARVEGTATVPEAAHLDRLKAMGSAGLEKYLGYYFETYCSMAYPGKILRNLVRFEQREGGVYYRRSERLVERPGEKAYRGVYRGMAHFLTDRIFLVDYETLTGLEISQTILFPSFKNRITRLTGLKLGVSGSGERMPCSARVVYDYLGRAVDLRQALSLCGLYEPDDPRLDAALRAAITNDIAPGEVLFRARFA
jgi:transcriptional regulator with XRE-family HTH domain